MATALSSKDAAAVKKAATMGGLTSSQGSQIVSAANAGKTVNVNASGVAAPAAPSASGGWKDPINAGNTPGGTMAAPGLTGAGLDSTVPQQVQNTVPQGTTPGALTTPDTITDPLTGASFTKGATPGATYQPNKFQQGLAAAQGSGKPAPQVSGDGKVGTSAFTPPQEADTSMVDDFVSQDPGVQNLFKSVTDLLQPQNQTTSLLDDYKSLYKESGLDQINAEIIDADTVINGTEQDIRNEIQGAGGLATDSQVQAMSLARNTSLVKRYNQLVQMKTDASNQLNTMTQLDAQDKQLAQQRINTQIDATFKLADFQQQTQNNIREAFNNMVNKVGYAGAYAAYSQDPKQLGHIEQIMGYAPGELHALSLQPDLDQQLKQAQIANINSEISERNAPAAGMAPEDLIAYAQQYAATGQIPTGIPKGGFGVVSAYAKELPKPDGAIVNATTGVAGGNLSSTQVDALGALHDLTKKLGDLQTKYADTGLLSTTAQRQGYKDMSGEIVDLLARARSGGALTEDEVEGYQAKIPELFGITNIFGANRPSVGAQKITDLQNSIAGKLQTQLDAHGASMYGFSTVNLDGTPYKVGDIISVNGVQGRVLPDGSISKL